MAEDIFGLVLPKYGMVMTEGLISVWHVEEGADVTEGDEIVDIETEKVANSYESPKTGVLRRKLVSAGQSLPVGGLFGVIADADLEDARIDAYVEAFNAEFAATQSHESAEGPEIVIVPSGYVRFLKKGEGSGWPVVLVHGFAGDLNSWLLNQDALGESRTVYALDLPGHGGSAAPPALDSIDDLARTIEEFLDAQGLTKVHLVGHSLGGGITAKVALNRPQQVASLTLIAPIGLGAEINSGFIEGILTADRRAEMKTVLERLFHDAALVSRDMIKDVLQSKRIDGAVEALRQIAERCTGTQHQVTRVRETLSTVSSPVQVIWGRSDQIIPCEHAAKLPEQIAVHRIEEAGHMVHMERPGEINRLITRFVTEHDR
ncbi:acetoin dehydrogenase dihydrolipoyllysine-residue acetyltransferase subunit [Mesorhizobium sp. M0204]|uniref:acetoin dehydrogenase dihydrolipoyllysine-residue acetyltransferase subunit n=1 Tax=Mesorhizobium sp. M0204 TaxID=2956913 RepID=UPI003334B678